MPRETDQPDEPNTLPAPELNPLLNPLLGQNMGRWAEVYFKSPPEKREQAVLELLRELRAENPGIEGATPSASASGSEQAFRQLDPIVLPAADAPQPAISCRACGRENPASHRFCGMCGESLLEAAAVADFPTTDLGAAGVAMSELAQPQTTGFHVSDLHIADEPVADQRLVDQRLADQPFADPRPENHFIQERVSERASNRRPLDQTTALPHAENQFTQPREAVYESALNTGELSLFQRTGQSGYSDGQAEEMFLDPAPRRPYRVYVGIVLAVVIFVLGFMAWRSMQMTSQDSRVEPQAPPVAATQPAPEGTNGANALKEETPNRPVSVTAPAAQTNAGHTSANQASENQGSSNQGGDRPAGNNRTSADAGKPSDSGLSAPSATPSTATTAQKAPAEAASGYGAEELATAQHFLDGADGQERNPAEAAGWLWKAMAKHNAKAPLLLADLYLKGEGVSKNCDQARVLLDSATRAGVKDAAERLRHLQAFGCQ